MAPLEKSTNYSRFQYTTEDLQNAIDQVKSKQMSLGRASTHYHVPKSTLYSYIHNNVPIRRKIGPQPVLFPSEELRIKNWILAKAKLGFPMHPQEVKIAVQKVLKDVGRPNPFSNDLPGRKWFPLFLKRHPEIVLTNTEVISKARAAVTEESIRKWFDMLHDYLQEENAEDIFNDPSRKYNLDEIGMQTCPKTEKVLGQKGEKNHYVISSGPGKQSITVLCCFGASGEGVDPLIVYPYQRIRRDIMEKVPDNIAVGRSPTGWMISATFYEYVANIFYKRLVERNIKFPVILFLDGHKSHISMELHEFCVEKQILLVCLPPNATHIIQPCDVGIFRPLKIQWRKVVQQHQQSTTKPITKINFAPLFATAYENAMKTETVQKAFKCCGLYPLDPDNVNYSKCISTRRKELFDLESPDSIALSNLNKSILDLESQMPPDVKKMFVEAYESKVEPVAEKVLYSIWKKLKDGSSSLAQEVGIQNSLSNEIPEIPESSRQENDSTESNVSTSNSQMPLDKSEFSSADYYFDSNIDLSDLTDIPIELEYDGTLQSINQFTEILPTEGSNVQISVPVIDISNIKEPISRKNSSVISESIPDYDQARSNFGIIPSGTNESLNGEVLDLSMHDEENKTKSASNEFSKVDLDSEIDPCIAPSFTCLISLDCDGVKTDRTALNEISKQDSNVIIVKLNEEIKKNASPELLATIFNNYNDTCFYGVCHYCSSAEPICGVGNILEGSVILWLPSHWRLIKYKHPWQRTYSESRLASWEFDRNYCGKVQRSKIYSLDYSSRLLDLIDAAIFDFIMDNGDRHHYEILEDSDKNSAILLIDNGKSLGNPDVDHIDILAPLYQCCLIHKTTWKRLQLFSGGSLGYALKELLAHESSKANVLPLITNEHLNAMERRLLTVFGVVEFCIQKNQYPANVIIN